MEIQKQTYSVLIVSAADAFTKSIMPLLPAPDYQPVAAAQSAEEARQKFAEAAFDLVLINTPLPDDFGMELAAELCANSGAGVLLMVKSDYFDEVYEKAIVHGVMTLAKPTNQQMITQSLRALCAVRERMRQAEARRVSVEEKMEEARLVNRAKWLLIECLDTTEPEAHRYIEKLAMDRRVSKREVAESIIKTYK